MKGRIEMHSQEIKSGSNLPEIIKDHCIHGMEVLEASARKKDTSSEHSHWCKGYFTALQDICSLLVIWEKQQGKR